MTDNPSFGGSSPLARWPLRQHTRRVPTTSSRSTLVRSDYAFPKGETGAGFGSPLLWEFDHHGASTSPGRHVVVLSAASPRGQRSGACLDLLPRDRRRHLFHHPSSDSAEALPFVVAHRRCSSFAAHRLPSAKTRRCAFEDPAFASAPLCSSTRTSQGRRRECATTSREFTTKRRAQFVPGRR